jgi:pimeloyl-ACP methyl ester carboxylesterase
LATFALVHGARHGAWCWERLTPELERLGHATVAMDLPCDDPAATLTDYAGVVAAAIDGVDGDVVLVAHSLGGPTLPLVARDRPVRRCAYVCALLAAPGLSIRDQMRAEPDIFVDVASTASGEFERVRETFYADCSEPDARWAFERLRDQAGTPFEQPAPADPEPEVERLYVLCSEDRVVNPDWSRRAVPERLGVAPIELPGSHSPFIAQPQALAATLAAGL